MKKLFKSFCLPHALFALFVCGAVVGCAKQEDPAIVGETVQKSQQAVTVTSEADYDAVFAATTKMLDEGTHLVITKVKDGYVFTVESGPISAAKIPVCHDVSATLGFAKCCRSYVIDHGCIQVSNSGGVWNGYACGA